MTLLVFFIIILPLTLIATVVVNQVYALVQHLDFREMFGNFLNTDIYTLTLEPLLHRLETALDTKINFLDYATQFIKERALALSRFSPKVVIGTAGFFFDFFLMMVAIFFLYLEGPALFRFLMKLSPMRADHELLIVEQFKTTIRATIFGTLVTSLVQSLLATIGFFICDIPIALILGGITFFTSMIPFVGTTIVWAPVCVWLFLQGQVGLGLFQLVYGVVVVAGIDNIIKPLIIGGKNKTHPLLIFFSLIGGLSLMGPFGIFYGPVILASLIATITIYSDEVTK